MISAKFDQVGIILCLGAHADDSAQDIVTHDGSSIVELARHLGRILEIGSAFPDLKRSTPVGDQ